MRSLLSLTATLAALLALAGCQKEPTPAESLKDDAPPAATGAAGNTAAPTGATGQLPPGVQAKDVPGMGAPPPAGSPQATQGGAPQQGAPTQ